MLPGPGGEFRNQNLPDIGAPTKKHYGAGPKIIRFITHMAMLSFRKVCFSFSIVVKKKKAKNKKLRIKLKLLVCD